MEPTLHNPARQRLQAGELAPGVGIRQSRTVGIAAIIKACGYHWLFLDLEHNSMDLDTAVQISVAAFAVRIAPMVRVPAGRNRRGGARSPTGSACVGINAAALVVVKLETPGDCQCGGARAVPAVRRAADRHRRFVDRAGYSKARSATSAPPMPTAPLSSPAQHRKYPGMGGVYEDSLMRCCLGMGHAARLGRRQSRLHDGCDPEGRAAARDGYAQ